MFFELSQNFQNIFCRSLQDGCFYLLEITFGRMVAWPCYFTKWTLSGLQMFLDRFDVGWRSNFLMKTSGGCYCNKLFSYSLFQKVF